MVYGFYGNVLKGFFKFYVEFKERQSRSISDSGNIFSTERRLGISTTTLKMVFKIGYIL